MGQILFNGLRNVWTTVTDRFGRVVARFIIWCIGVAVAFFPAIDSADVGIEWPPARMAAEINERGYFCDLFFVSVVVAILAISNLLDIIIRRVHTLGWITRALAITGMGYQIIYILYAVNHFGRLTWPSYPSGPFLLGSQRDLDFACRRYPHRGYDSPHGVNGFSLVSQRLPKDVAWRMMMDLISPQVVVWAGWVSIVVLAIGVFVRAAWPMLDRNGSRSVKRGHHVRHTEHAPFGD